MKCKGGESMADSAPLQDAISQIACADVPAKRIEELQELAVKEFLVPGATMARGAKTSACADLAVFYRLVSKQAGTKIERPSQAAAFLKQLGIAVEFPRRMSRLSSKRKMEAHPDVGFIADLTQAFEALGPAAIADAAAKFRAGASGSTQSAGDTSEIESDVCGAPSVGSEQRLTLAERTWVC